MFVERKTYSNQKSVSALEIWLHICIHHISKASSHTVSYKFNVQLEPMILLLR